MDTPDLWIIEKGDAWHLLPHKPSSHERLALEADGWSIRKRPRFPERIPQAPFMVDYTTDSTDYSNPSERH